MRQPKSVHSAMEGIILCGSVFCSAFHPLLQQQHSIGLLALSLIATLVTYTATLPTTWITASRTTTSEGYGIQYGLVLLPLTFAGIQVYKSSKHSEVVDDYNSLLFWCCTGCSLLTVVRSTALGQHLLVHTYNLLMAYVVIGGVVCCCWQIELLNNFVIVFVLVTLMVYDGLFHTWKTLFPKSFTIGEAVLVIQCLSVASVDFCAYATCITFNNLDSLSLLPRTTLTVFLQGNWITRLPI